MSTTNPHASWAHCYDFVYEQGHGAVYDSLTALTIETIQKMQLPPCSVIDFGAGTGRLTIPLAQLGYDVTAVEPCQEMMDVLLAKSRRTDAPIHARVERMQDARFQNQFDLALCVFTTVTYLLDEPTLRRAMAVVAESLKPHGRLLIDLPRRHAFTSYQRQTPNLSRNVTVTAETDDRYTYSEQTRCLLNGTWQSCRDQFSIRYWPPEIVLTTLREYGIECEGPFPKFSATGSDYYQGKKG